MSRRPEPNHSFHFFGLLLPWLTVRNEHVGSTHALPACLVGVGDFRGLAASRLVLPARLNTRNNNGVNRTATAGARPGDNRCRSRRF